MEAIKKIELNKIAKLILLAVLGTLLLTISAKVYIYLREFLVYLFLLELQKKELASYILLGLQWVIL